MNSFLFMYRLIEASKLAVFEYLAIPSSFFLVGSFLTNFPLINSFPRSVRNCFGGHDNNMERQKKEKNFKK